MKNMVSNTIKNKLSIALEILPESFVLNEPIKIKHLLSVHNRKLLLPKGTYIETDSSILDDGEQIGQYSTPDGSNLVIGIMEFNQIKKHLRI